MTAADTVAKWLSTARAQAALHGIELHAFEDGEFVLTRGHRTERMRTRASLVAVLRVLGIEVDDPPTEAAS